MPSKKSKPKKNTRAINLNTVAANTTSLKWSKWKTGFRTVLFKARNVVRDKIFAELDYQSKLAVRKVCKRWKNVVDETMPFRVVLTDATYPYVDNFARGLSGKRPVWELVVGQFSSQLFPDHWKFIGGVKSLKIVPTEEMHEMEVGGVMSAEMANEMLSRFRNVEKFSFASSTLAELKQNSIMRSLEFPQLSCLEILVEGDLGLAAVNGILDQTFETLAHFSITIKSEDDMTLYADTYAFVSRHFHLKSFKRNVIPPNLTSDETLVDQNNNLFKPRCLTLMRLEAALYAAIFANLGSVKLSILDIHVLTWEGKGQRQFGLHLLKCQNTLHTLHICNIRPENIEVWRTIPTILNLCSKTLQSVTLDGCFCTFKYEGDAEKCPGPFWCHWLEQCHNLKRLEVFICGMKVVDVNHLPKNIRTLCLGRMLAQRQMRAITETCKNLEEISWPQMNADQCDVDANDNHLCEKFEPSKSRAVTLLQFRRACKLPNLKKLTICTKCCKLKSIRKFAGGLVGIYENMRESKRGDLEFIIDRSLFACPM